VRQWQRRAVQVRRAEGKLRNLEEAIRLKRWKAAGASATRAGPLTDAQQKRTPIRIATGTGKIVVVHNGIVENYLSLKKKLIEEGHKFSTETDTEVIAHLIEKAIYPLGNGITPVWKKPCARR